MIAKFNKAVPFYLTINELEDESLKKVIEEAEELRERMVGWIMERK